MAKTKSGPNKSEEIRNVLKASPNMPARAVMETLKAKGVEVTDALVYAVKKSLKKVKKNVAVVKTESATTSKVETPAPHVSNGTIGVGSSIRVARTAAEKVGGWTALKEIVDAMQ